MPPSGLIRYWVDLLTGAKGEWFHTNLKSKEVKILSCYRLGRMTLDGKRIFERKCWLTQGCQMQNLKISQLR